MPQSIHVLGALAHEHCLKSGRVLVERGPDGLPAGALIVCLLKRRRGRQLIYSADFEAMSSLVSYLTENGCGASDQCVPACQPVSNGKGSRAA
jgi:hypothetical protein